MFWSEISSRDGGSHSLGETINPGLRRQRPGAQLHKKSASALCVCVLAHYCTHLFDDVLAESYVEV